MESPESTRIKKELTKEPKSKTVSKGTSIFVRLSRKKDSTKRNSQTSVISKLVSQDTLLASTAPFVVISLDQAVQDVDKGFALWNASEFIQKSSALTLKSNIDGLYS